MSLPTVPPHLIHYTRQALRHDEPALRLLETAHAELAGHNQALLLQISRWSAEGRSAWEVGVLVASLISGANQSKAEGWEDRCACGHRRREHERVSDSHEPCEECRCTDFSLARGELEGEPAAVKAAGRVS